MQYENNPEFYSDAMKEFEEIKQEWINLRIKVESYYLQPKKMLRVPHEIAELVGRENKLVEQIKKEYPYENDQKAILRYKYQEAQAEFKLATQASMDVEKRLMGFKPKEAKK